MKGLFKVFNPSVLFQHCFALGEGLVPFSCVGMWSGVCVCLCVCVHAHAPDTCGCMYLPQCVFGD